MITADLLIRVSTEEQADKGFSQRDQEERLRRYCEIQGWQVRSVVVEDHSAKNFSRPEFKKLLIDYKKNHPQVNYLLFTKWSRFIRNITDGFLMIRDLMNYGIEVNAIEQWVDFKVPQHKLMLAFYLAEPDVDNHVRSITVKQNMIKAMREGKFMGKAPAGYRNRKDEKSKWIEPDPEKEPFICKIFSDLATGRFSAESVLSNIRQSGFKCSKNNFWNIIRNPVYVGMIRVPAYAGQPELLVKGQHQAIIEEDVFLKVQDVLISNKKPQKEKRSADIRFPLRGSIKCHKPGCSRLLTASASRGRHRHYEYYHCTSSCGTRFSANLVNEAFMGELRKWKPHPAVTTLFKKVLADLISKNRHQQYKDIQQLRERLAAIQQKQTRARDLLLDGDIDPTDYQHLKKKLENENVRIESDLAALAEGQKDITQDIEKGVAVIAHMDEYYQSAPPEVKKDIIGSIFPEKLEFDGVHFRTARINEVIRIIFSLEAAFSQKEMGQISDLTDLSHQVIPLVPFSNHFLHDLRKLTRLYHLLKAS